MGRHGSTAPADGLRRVLLKRIADDPTDEDARNLLARMESAPLSPALCGLPLSSHFLTDPRYTDAERVLGVEDVRRCYPNRDLAGINHLTTMVARAMDDRRRGAPWGLPPDGVDQDPAYRAVTQAETPPHLQVLRDACCIPAAKLVSPAALAAHAAKLIQDVKAGDLVFSIEAAALAAAIGADKPSAPEAA